MISAKRSAGDPVWIIPALAGGKTLVMIVLANGCRTPALGHFVRCSKGQAGLSVYSQPSVAGEVDEPTFDIGVDQFDTNTIAHIEPLIPALQPTFGRGPEDPDPGPFVGGPGHNGVE